MSKKVVKLGSSLSLTHATKVYLARRRKKRDFEGVDTGVWVRDTHPLTIESNEHRSGCCPPSPPLPTGLPPNGNRAREYGGVMF